MANFKTYEEAVQYARSSGKKDWKWVLTTGPEWSGAAEYAGDFEVIDAEGKDSEGQYPSLASDCWIKSHALVLIESSDSPNFDYEVKPFGPSGQGKKFDGGKTRWALLPWKAAAKVVEVLEFGAKKYGPNNWQSLENGVERYNEAAIRHISARMQGEKSDPETGLPHLAHAGCCILFALFIDESEHEDV